LKRAQSLRYHDKPCTKADQRLLSMPLVLVVLLMILYFDDFLSVLKFRKVSKNELRQLLFVELRLCLYGIGT
jgi:hypothetical protein